MLCIRRSVVYGRLVGFTSGLGAATADAIYGAFAVFGLTAVSQFLLESRLWIELFGGLILIGIGVATYRAHPVAPGNGDSAPKSSGAAYVSTLLLTLMNPMTILSFLAIFAGLGLRTQMGSMFSAWSLVLGVFLGSVAWWLVVSMTGGWLGGRLNHGGLRIVNWIAGSVIALLGAWQLVEFVRHL